MSEKESVFEKNNNESAERRLLLRRIGTTVSGLVILLIALACARPRPVYATLAAPTFHVTGDAETTRDGLTVGITPITTENARQFAQVYRRIAWTETNTSTGQAVQVERSGEGPIIPMPAFRVHIANHTGHALHLTSAVFRLQDNTGRSYQIFPTTPELQAWYEGLMASSLGAAANDPTVQSQMRSSFASLQLLNRNLELLNGDDWNGYLVFNLGYTSSAEALAFLNSTDRLTLRLAEIPVETNDAGTVTRTTEFSFVFGKTTYMQPVECPAGTTQPSFDVCRATNSSGGST